MILFYEKSNDTFYFKCRFEEKDIPKSNGFRWDKNLKLWYTTDAVIAMRLRNYANKEALERIEQSEENIKNSNKAKSEIEIPKPENLEYMPFQKAAIEYAINRKYTLFGDEPGLGKTIEAIGVINATNPEKVLIICTNTLKLNWEKELKKWLVHNKNIKIVENKIDFDFSFYDILIINYERLIKIENKDVSFDLLIIDECHKIKNKNAKRTKAILDKENGLIKKAKKVIFISGTPFLNHPIELFSILEACDSNKWKFWPFVKRYCNAEQGSYGWDFSGASNIEELQMKLRDLLMIRRQKKDVLKELPDKIRQIIVFPANNSNEQENELIRQYKEILKQIENAKLEKEKISNIAYENMIKELNKKMIDVTSNVFRARHQTSLSKIPLVVEHIKNILEEDYQKLVIFAHHLDVIEGIKNGLREYTCEILTGETPVNKRQEIVESFQNKKDPLIIIAGINVAGLGITLTAAKVACFAELDWVPANITQCEDRLHRIGQKTNVLIQHLVLDKSIDLKIAEKIIEKQKLFDQGMNVDSGKILREIIQQETKENA